MPEKVTMDKSGANKAAIDKVNLLLAVLYLFTGIYYQILVQQIKYLNNIIEQDHRAIKRITKMMMGFKSIPSAQTTTTGIEIHHMLKKGQHKNVANVPVYKQFYALTG